MVALTVEGPAQPRNVELVDTRTCEWGAGRPRADARSARRISGAGDHHRPGWHDVLGGGASAATRGGRKWAP